MSNFRQTWWDDNLKEKYKEFESWVGDSTAVTKAFFRGYVKSMGYKTLLDVGCGNATEYFAYDKEYPELYYLGVDSSKYLYDRNKALGVPMVQAMADNIPFAHNEFEVVFSRHVLEHQPNFRPVLSEMIRLAKIEAIHVFFIPPGEEEIISYQELENLYHNTFKKEDIENFLKEREDVESFSWLQITETETALSIMKKASE